MSTQPAAEQQRPGDGGEERLERLVQTTTRRVCFLPRGPVLFDYDDALAVARIAAWKAHVAYQPSFRCRWDSWVITKIRLALKEAFRSFDTGAQFNRAGVRAPDFVPLEATLRAKVNGSNEPESPSKVEDTLADPHDAFAACETRLECGTVLRVLRWLTPREAAVLRGYYLEDVTLKVIAGRLELSESRVHQIHQKALERARMMLGMGEEV